MKRGGEVLKETVCRGRRKGRGFGRQGGEAELPFEPKYVYIIAGGFGRGVGERRVRRNLTRGAGKYTPWYMRTMWGWWRRMRRG